MKGKENVLRYQTNDDRTETAYVTAEGGNAQGNASVNGRSRADQADAGCRPDGHGAAEGTLGQPVRLSGVGLHSGAPVELAILPALEGHGIVFRRTDLDRDNDIPAHYDTVADTTLCTVVANQSGASVGTVEHLMSALAVFGIDNALIEVSGPEVPVMDGSAIVYAEAFAKVGRVELSARRKAIKILKPVIVEEGNKRAALLPHSVSDTEAPGLTLDFEIEFDNRVIGHERFTADIWREEFANDVLQARTFGLLKDVEAMWQMGLAKGGNLENCVVVDADAVMNPDGLRFDDEFVRHKMLDAVGDLALAGAPLIGRYEGVRSGHAMNNKLLHALFAAPDAWTYVDALPQSLPDPDGCDLAVSVTPLALSAD